MKLKEKYEKYKKENPKQKVKVKKNEFYSILCLIWLVLNPILFKFNPSNFQIALLCGVNIIALYFIAKLSQDFIDHEAL